MARSNPTATGSDAARVTTIASAGVVQLALYSSELVSTMAIRYLRYRSCGLTWPRIRPF